MTTSLIVFKTLTISNIIRNTGNVTGTDYGLINSCCLILYNETLRHSPPTANEGLHNDNTAPKSHRRRSPDKYGLAVIDTASPEGGCVVDEMLLLPVENALRSPETRLVPYIFRLAGRTDRNSGLYSFRAATGRKGKFFLIKHN